MTLARGNTRVILLLLLVAVAIRGAFVIANYRGVTVTLHSDSGSYLQEADRFLKIGEMELCFRLPGYPLFLALTGLNLRFCLVLQGLLGILTCALVYWGTRERCGSRPAALALLFVAFDMTSIIYGNFLVSEALFTPLLTAALFLLLRPGSLASIMGSAVLLGAAVYVRPAAAGLGVLWPLLLRFVFKDGRSALVSFGVTAAIVVPWLFRQKARCGEFALSLEQSYHLLVWNAGYVQADAEGARLEDVQERLAAGVPRSDHNRRALEIIAAHPLRFAWLWAKSAAINLLSPAHEAFRFMFPRAGPWLRAAEAAVACLFWLWLWLVPVSLRYKTCLAAAVTAVYFLVISGPAYHSRFRVPVVPALAFCAAAGLQNRLDLERKRQARVAERQTQGT